jgi:hypothetical protein
MGWKKINVAFLGLYYLYKRNSCNILVVKNMTKNCLENRQSWRVISGQTLGCGCEDRRWGQQAQCCDKYVALI